MIQGHRKPDDTNPFESEQGDFWREGVGTEHEQWVGHCPVERRGNFPCIANLQAHEVTEHEDGTITVSPSIKVTTTEGPDHHEVELYHGWLRNGVWTEA